MSINGTALRAAGHYSVTTVAHLILVFLIIPASEVQPGLSPLHSRSIEVYMLCSLYLGL